MDNIQDDVELDIENNRTVFLKENDPFLPIIPSPGIQEEPLEERLKTPPATPIHSPHAFFKEDRWLFSPPPVLTSEHTNLDNFETGFNLTPQDTDKKGKSTALRKRAARPTSLVLSSEENPPRKRVKPATTSEPSTSVGIEHFGVPSFLLVRPVPLSVGTEPAIWNSPPLLQIVSHPTSDLVRKLTTSRISYVSPLACQTSRK